MSIAYQAAIGAEGWSAGLPTELDIDFIPARGAGARLGESPFWDHGDSVWWVDIDERRLLRTRLSTRSTESWPTPEIPGFVVLAGPHCPAIGMESGIFAFSVADATFSRLLSLDGTGMRFNDATVDNRGRLWTSTMALDARKGCGAVCLVSDDMELRTVLTDLTTPNGLAADVSGGRLFVSDSHPDAQSIWTLPCDFATTATGARVAFASTVAVPGRPDGAALATGGEPYWIASVDGAALHGYSRQGALACVVPLAFPAPTKLAFFDGGVAVTAKGQGGYGGQLALAVDVPSVLRGPAVPFWRPGWARNSQFMRT